MFAQEASSIGEKTFLVASYKCRRKILCSLQSNYLSLFDLFRFSRQPIFLKVFGWVIPIFSAYWLKSFSTLNESL